MLFLSPYAPVLLSLMRVVCGLAFLQYGMSKFFGFPASPLSGVGLSDAAGWTGIAELVCGGLLVAGLYTRIAAFGAFAFVVGGLVLVHGAFSGVRTISGDEVAILSSICFLYLASAGGGPVSLDRLFDER